MAKRRLKFYLRDMAAAGLLAVCALTASAAHGKGASAPLAVALDQENLPFSSQRGAPPGLNTEIALAVAERLGAPLKIRWVETLEVGPLTSLLSEPADTNFAVGIAMEPNMVEDTLRVGELILYSLPYASMRYVVVSRADERERNDVRELGRVPIGAEVGSVAAQTLWEQGFLLRRFGSEARILEELAGGGLDFGVMWPSAGWQIAQEPRYRESLKIQTLDLAMAALEWNFAIAVAPANRRLLPLIDSAILQMKRENQFESLFAKYHMPYFRPTSEEGARPR